MFCWKNRRVTHYIRRANAASISIEPFRSAILIVVAAAFTCSSCLTGKKESSFYSIDSLVTEQVTQLTELKARLSKSAVVQGKSDSISYVPKDTTEWIKELGIFRQLQIINKPVNHGSYLVDDGLLDPASNLTVKAFTSTEQLPVRYMKIYYQRSVSNPRKIEALYDEENTLYKSSRLLSLEFSQINNKIVLTSYSIDGGQKMVMGDSVTFLIKGNITIE
jgi:hypothetical protein